MKTLLRRAAGARLFCLLAAALLLLPATVLAGERSVGSTAPGRTYDEVVVIDKLTGEQVTFGGGGGGGGGDASAANQVILNNRIGDLIASPAQYSLADRLKTINTTLGTPFQAGGSIGNTAFGISGTLPAFASTPTVNLGTIGGAATAANQATLNGYYMAEDAVHASGDKGLLSLAVSQANRYATPTSGTAGDYEAAKTDPDGNVFVARSDGKPITVTPLAATGVLFSVDTLGWDSVAFQPTGTWVGSIVFEGSDDNSNWVQTNVYNALGGTVSSQTNSTNNSLYSYVAQHRYFRGRASVYTSGTITGSAYLRTGPPAGYSNASSDALLTSILAKIIAAPATETTLAAMLAKQKGPLTFTQTAGSPFTLTSSWTKVATTTAATKGLIVAPSVNASAFDIEWTSVTAGAAAPTDLYGVPVGYGETFADGLPIGDVYLKSATGMVATVRTGS